MFTEQIIGGWHPAGDRQRPKGQGLGFTLVWKEKVWHSWIHIGKRVAWNNLWSGALGSCVYRIGRWHPAGIRQRQRAWVSQWPGNKKFGIPGFILENG